MTKVFCDGCGKDLSDHKVGDDDLVGGKNFPDGSFGVKRLTFKVEFKGGGDWCKYCILGAVAELDDRPRCVSK